MRSLTLRQEITNFCRAIGADVIWSEGWPNLLVGYHGKVNTFRVDLNTPYSVRDRWGGMDVRVAHNLADVLRAIGAIRTVNQPAPPTLHDYYLGAL